MKMFFLRFPKMYNGSNKLHQMVMQSGKICKEMRTGLSLRKARAEFGFVIVYLSHFLVCISALCCVRNAMSILMGIVILLAVRKKGYCSVQ
jgi:hypothetical protein